MAVEVQFATGSSVTTRTVAEFAARLGDSAPADRVVIDVSELEDVDLTFVQTVDVYRAELAEASRVLALSTQANPNITSLLARCGYREGADPSDLEFWIGEETV
ncbi:STAS domain-containing protein [Novosphingobium sp. G106]|uniref:STAS domain-containing protein n=1 Tax=Novosphingobium sp. G106 TaxID=2849500 RepID=UPI001C2D04E2|nr:STAS domain-containing protein [Novosphingobium sp. G106]MBV1688138.1 STAS domain-containing protein [Novosphingobium sp. G106]